VGAAVKPLFLRSGDFELSVHEDGTGELISRADNCRVRLDGAKARLLVWMLTSALSGPAG